MKAKIFLSFVLLMAISAAAISDSLWTEKSTSPYSTKKPYKIGDLITILIVENTSAAQNAGTNTKIQDSLSANFSQTLTSLTGASTPNTSLQGGVSNAYQGTGSTTRSSNVLAAVSATIMDILPNKNLLISGSHKVSVNEEIQEIKVEGVVRPDDISGWNSVYSYQVADSKISVKGSGSVGEAEAPGLLFRLINWLF